MRRTGTPSWLSVRRSEPTLGSEADNFAVAPPPPARVWAVGGGKGGINARSVSDIRQSDACAGNPGSNRVQRIWPAPDQCHPGPVARQLPRNRRTDASATAGDNGMSDSSESWFSHAPESLFEL